jgi:hypothetical protein
MCILDLRTQNTTLFSKASVIILFKPLKMILTTLIKWIKRTLQPMAPAVLPDNRNQAIIGSRIGVHAAAGVKLDRVFTVHRQG